MIRPMVAKLSNQILDEATHWFVEFGEADLSHSQREHFIAWLRASPVLVGIEGPFRQGGVSANFPGKLADS